MSDSQIMLRRAERLEAVQAFDEAVPICQVLDSCGAQAGIENFEHLRATREESARVSYTMPALVVLRRGVGKAGVRANNMLREYAFKPESIVVFPADFEHICQPASGSDFYCMTFREGVLRSVGDEVGIHDAPSRMEPVMGRQDPLLSELVFAMHRALMCEIRESQRLLRESIANSIMIRLLQTAIESATNAMHAPSMAGLRGRIGRITDFLRDDPGCDVGLSDLARMASLSPSHFVRCFKKYAGMTPAEFQRKQRIAMAERMMRNDDIPLQEIAAAVGFNSVQGMRKAYARVNGMSMRDVRRRGEKAGDGSE
jgi:AraC-like DNA-binding protein